MKTKPRAIRFTEDEDASIANFAEARGLTFSDVVRQATREYIALSDEGKLSLDTLAELSSSEDPDLLYEQFLDDFNHARDKEELIANEPDWKGQNISYWSCLLAATAHKLAHDNSIPVPKWALESRYISSDPIYGMNTTDPDFQAYLRETTPMEFRSHNIYLGGNVFSRA
jgi:hypothetical protein